MILIVDDDPSVTASLGLLLKQHGHASRAAASPEEALRELAGAGFDLLLQDMNFSRSTSGREGLELLEKVRKQRPQLPVILITAWGSISLAVEGMKLGASDFITKPWSNAHLMQAVETAMSLAETRAAQPGTATRSREELDRRHDFRGFLGNNPQVLRILELVGRVGPTDASVLVTGESGTGKEQLAEAIHRNSRRKDAGFVKVNLGGISSTLFESEMFGHVKGAFTDARKDRRGRFEVADGGTIFLDEIGELEPGSQVKLLRVLQDRTYEMLGSSITRTVDVRVISATNQDLPERVEQGRFREDLLYRLNLISFRLPSLRERRDDIPLLASHFLDGFAHMYHREALSIAPRAMEWLQAQEWPGNVRQLKQTVERAVLVLQGDRLEMDDLLVLSELETREARAGSLPTPGSMTLDEIEKAMIVKCMKHYGGNISRVADALGLSRAALYRRFQKYDVAPSRS